MRLLASAAFVASVALALSLGLLPNLARASAPPAQIVGAASECIVERGAAAFDIPTNNAVITALHFPGQYQASAVLGEWARDFTIDAERSSLFVAPLPNRPGARLTLLVESENPAWKLTLFLHATDNPDSAMKACRFVARDAAEAEQQRIHAAVEQAEAGLWAKLEDVQQKRDNAQTLAMIKGRLFGDGELMPSVRAMRGTSEQVGVQLGRAVYHEGDLWTTFFIENQAWQPLRLANIQVLNKNGTILPLQDVVLEPPAVPHGDALGLVPVGHRVAGLMRLPGLAEGIEPHAITFTGFTGARMFAVTAEEPIWVWVPRREDQVREELRQEAALRAARGVVTLGLKGVYGAIWLGDGAGLDRSDATSLKGLGVRIMYGLTPMWAVEGEIMGAGSGNAFFEDVTWNGMQGNLTRRAGLGRAQFGGVLRFGERYIPMLRMGVGLQGASHSGTLATATGKAPGPDAFDFDLLWYAGIGVDVRVGPIVAGIAVSGDQEFDSGSRGIRAGLHLGYAWKP